MSSVCVVDANRICAQCILRQFWFYSTTRNDLLYYSILFNDKYRSNLPRIIITTTHRSKTKQTCRLKERERFYWCAFSRIYSLSLFSSLSLGEIAPIQFLSNGLVVRFLIKFINHRVLFYRRARSILASSNQTLVDSKASLRRTCRKRFRSRRNTRVVMHLFSHCKTRTGSKKPTTLRLCILTPTKSRSTDGWKIIKILNYQN